MAIGTRSLLYGVHCFLIHPFFVALAWYRLYGFPWDPRLWVAFFLHDVGYWGKPNMDGPEGETHPELGAAIVGFLFGPKWRDFTLLHSRSYARRLGRSPSPLCAADKLVVTCTPWWLYFPFACATGELSEYMAQSGEDVPCRGLLERLSAFRPWYARLQQELKAWAERDIAKTSGKNCEAKVESTIGAARFDRSKLVRCANPALVTDHDHPLRLFWSCCLPAMIGMATEAICQWTTRMTVGRALGSDGLAQIAIAFPCSLLLLGFSLLFASGAASIVAVRLGEKRTSAAERTLGTMLVAQSATGFGVALIGFLFLDPILRVLGGEPANSEHLSGYLRILFGGAWFQLLAFGATFILRATGRPWTSSWLALGGLGVNVAVTCACLFGFDSGIAGVAVGAIASNGAVAIVGLVCLSSRKAAVRLRFEKLSLSWSECVPLVSRGFSPFLMQIAAGTTAVLVNRQLETYGGATAVATMGIIYSVSMVIVLPTYGISAGMQPLVGFHHGAQQPQRVWHVLRTSTTAAMALTTLGGLAMMLIPDRLVLLFGGDRLANIESAASAMRLSALLMPFVGFQVIGLGYFQAIGKATRASFLAICRPLLLTIPAICFLPFFFGLDGIWLSSPVADVGMFLITGLALRPDLRKLLTSEAPTRQQSIQDRASVNRWSAKSRPTTKAARELRPALQGEIALRRFRRSGLRLYGATRT